MMSEISHLNDELVRLMCDMAQREPHATWHLVASLRHELTALTLPARTRMTQRPYLLVGFGLMDIPLWHRITGLDASLDRTPWTAGTSRRAALRLARSVLTLAWHATQNLPLELTSAKLGIAPQIAGRMAALPLHEVERIAERHAGLLAPRWAGRVRIWRHLLRAGMSDDPQALHAFDLHAAQLHSGDLLSFMPLAG